MSQIQYGIAGFSDEWETKEQAKIRHAKAKAKSNRIKTMRLRQTLMLKREAESKASYPTRQFAIAVIRKGELVGGKIVTGTELRKHYA